MSIKVIELRDYQVDAIFFICQALLRDDVAEVAAVSPTGSGKTTLVRAALKQLLGTKHFSAALILAPLEHIAHGWGDKNNTIYRMPWPIPDPTGRFRFIPQFSTTVIPAPITQFSFGRFAEQADGDRYAGKGQNILEFLRGAPRTGERLVKVAQHQSLQTIDTSATGGLEFGALPVDLQGKILVIDEGHHAGQGVTRIDRFRQEWVKRGGKTIIVTATPFRGDRTNVINRPRCISWIWSAAEHAKAGYAPNHLDAYSVPLNFDTTGEFSEDGDFTAEWGDLEIRRSCQKIVDTWKSEWVYPPNVDPIRPKTIFNVPSGRNEQARKWSDELVKQLSQLIGPDRVCNAYGESQKEAVIKILKSEERISDFKKSKLDAIVSCQRFNEGSDWPMCSHVFCVGLSRVFSKVIQRWGRAMRYKSGFKNYPAEFRDVAKIVFFTPKLKPGVQEQYRRDYHRYLMLLACYMERQDVASNILTEFRVKTEKHWEKRPKPSATNTTAIVDAIIDSNIRGLDIDNAEAKLNVAVAQRVVEAATGSTNISDIVAYMKTAGTLTASVVPELLNLVSEEQRDRIREDVLQALMGDRERVIIGDVPIEVFAASLAGSYLESFQRAAVKYDDLTNNVTGQISATVTKLTGQAIGDITQEIIREEIEFRSVPLKEHRVYEIAKLFEKENGRPPQNNDVIALGDVSTRWGSFEHAVRTGRNGMIGGTTIDIVMCVGDFAHKHPKFLTEEGIQGIAREVTIDIGTMPPTLDRAQPDEIRFQDISTPLNTAGRLSVLAIVNYMGQRGWLRDTPQEPIQARLNRLGYAWSANAVDRAGRAYHNMHGHFPDIKQDGAGEASSYFGLPPGVFTWTAVNKEATRRGFLGDVIRKWTSPEMDFYLHLSRHATPEVTRDAVCRYWDKMRREPSDTETATIHFPASIRIAVGTDFTWEDVGRANMWPDGIRGFIETSGLQRHTIIIEDVRYAIQAYLMIHREAPTIRAGSARPYIGFFTTWHALDQLLRKGRIVGSQKGTSLYQVCRTVEGKAA